MRISVFRRAMQNICIFVPGGYGWRPCGTIGGVPACGAARRRIDPAHGRTKNDGFRQAVCAVLAKGPARGTNRSRR